MGVSHNRNTAIALCRNKRCDGHRVNLRSIRMEGGQPVPDDLPDNAKYVPDSDIIGNYEGKGWGDEGRG
ncbi:MAG: hypothetical protein HC892_00315 [Saprospiraceae bacterium]|nr:hypothetical protein [Saprospiraceae bacterium]